jgi:uncharacterized membrane protein YbhN (UPF0104 family)
MKTKVRKTYNYLIRFLIIFATYGFIYQQVFLRQNLNDIFQFFYEQFSQSNYIWTIILLFILTFLNWATESLKWNLLINKIEKISWIRSFQAVLTGVAVSSFTPNRIGDYFGRVFILEKANRIEGIFITILGSMSQLLITFTLGSTAIYLMFLAYPETLMGFFNLPVYLFDYFLWGGAVLLIGINVLFILLFLNISLLSVMTSRLKGKLLKRVSSYIHVLSAYTLRELLLILLLSFLRFMIFSLQMYILLRLFDIDIDFLPGMMVIAVTFFVMTMIPTIAITELGIRGSVALFLIGIYFGNPMEMPAEINLGIVAASSALWLINLAIPALTGTVFVFNLKFFRRSGNE